MKRAPGSWIHLPNPICCWNGCTATTTSTSTPNFTCTPTLRIRTVMIVSILWILFLLPFFQWRQNYPYSSSLLFDTPNTYVGGHIQNHTIVNQAFPWTNNNNNNSNNSNNKYRFPRWNQTEGINLYHLVEFCYGVVNGTASMKPKAGIERRYIYPETPYLFEKDGIFVSDTMREQTWRGQIRKRVEPMEGLLQLAHRLLVQQQQQHDGDQNHNHNHNNDAESDERMAKTKWPRLQKAVFHGAGFPMILWYGDYRQCGYHNVRYAPHYDIPASSTARRSVPIFTTCAPVHCHYAFPLPTYEIILNAMPSSQAWEERFQEQEQRWRHGNTSSTSSTTTKSTTTITPTTNANTTSQIPKVVWRGSLSDNLRDSSYDYQTLPRWRVARMSHVEELLQGKSSVLDAGLTSIPRKHRGGGSGTSKNNSIPINLTLVGGLKKRIEPMEDFQRYVGILDLDGNSWSSRFGRLLCYDSIILKVEPDYVDLFMRDLIPGIHYLPIKEDLSNLLDVARFVTSRKHERVVQTIKKQAHDFCRTHMIWSKLAHDVLGILEEYLYYIEQWDPDWQTYWMQARHKLLQGGNTWRFREVTETLH